MLKKSFVVSEALPTIHRAYKPIEDYLDSFNDTGLAVPPAGVTPVDALIVHLLVGLCSGHPVLIDLAGEATQGVSTVLCCTQSKALRVIRQQSRARQDHAWPDVLTRFLEQGAANSLTAPRETAFGLSLTDPKQLASFVADDIPTLVLLPADGMAVADLSRYVRAWLEQGPEVLVLVLGLGATGQCAALQALATTFHSDSPQCFVLPRERAAAFHASKLGIVFHRAHPYFDHSLLRLAKLFTGNFSFLNLIKKSCAEAIQSANTDNAILEAHPLGRHAGTRRRIAELEQALRAAADDLRVQQATTASLQQALACRAQEAAELSQRIAELHNALVMLQQELQPFQQLAVGGFAFRLATRLERWRIRLFPEGTLRCRLGRQLLRITQRLSLRK